jgi:hypothetical protein
VVAAGELHHLAAAGEAAGEPDRRHRRLGAARDQPHLLDRVHAGDDLLGKGDLALGRSSVGRAAAGGRADRLDDLRVGMAEQERSPGADKVDVATAVGVGQPGTAALHHEARRPAHGPEGADRRVDPARRDAQGAVEQVGGRGRIVGVAPGGVGGKGGVAGGCHTCHPRRMRRGRQISLVLAVYLLIGIIVAYDRDYLTSRLLKSLVSALLAIFLWFLLLLDVDLHVG